MLGPKDGYYGPGQEDGVGDDVPEPSHDDSPPATEIATPEEGDDIQ